MSNIEQLGQPLLPNLREPNLNTSEGLREAIDADLVSLDYGLTLAEQAQVVDKVISQSISRAENRGHDTGVSVAQAIEGRITGQDMRLIQNLGQNSIYLNSTIATSMAMSGVNGSQKVDANDVRKGFAIAGANENIDVLDNMSPNASIKYSELEEVNHSLHALSLLTVEAEKDLVDFTDLSRLSEIDPFTALNRLTETVKFLSDGIYAKTDMNLLSGAALKGLTAMLDKEGIRKAIASDELLKAYYDDPDVSPAQIAFTLVMMSALQNQGCETDLDVVIHKLSEAGAKRGFGRQNEIRSRSANINALVNLSDSIHDTQVEALTMLKKIKDTVPRYTNAFTRATTTRILTELDEYIKLAGEKVEQAPEDDRQAAMIEALEADEYKHEVVKQVRNRLQGTAHANDHQLRETLQNFSRFRLDRILKGEEQSRQSAEIQALNAEQLQELLNQIDSLHKEYQLGGKALRVADPGFALTNVFREGYKSPTGKQLIEATEAEQAKVISAFLLILSQKFEEAGATSFDQLLTNLQTEHELIGQLQAAPKNNRRPAFIESQLDWVLEQLSALNLVDNQAMPPAVKNMLRALSEYVNLWQGNSEIETVEPETPEPIEEPVPDIVEEFADSEPEAEPEPEVEPEAPEEVPPLPDLPGEVINQADILDFEIFPPGASLADVATDVRKIVEGEDLQLIDWDRLRLLIELRDHYSSNDVAANLWRAQPGSLNSRLPYYALVLERDGHVIVVADNPQYGNATYVFEEKEGWGTWQEVASMPRLFVRDLYGGRRIIHPRNMQLDNPLAYKRHRDNINKDVIMFLSAQERQVV